MSLDRRVSRRTFLRNASALTSLGLAARFDPVGLIASASAQATTDSDYKALVCVFMFGGNDGNNTVIPLDTAGYAAYSSVRTSASGIQLAQSSLQPIQPANSPTPYGLHPALAELKELFDARRMAILANVGTLSQPTTKEQYAQGVRPLSLYSHADQQAQWQSAVSNAPSATGWGGRVADQVAALNAASGFPVVTSLDGTVQFTTGDASVPLWIPVSGAFALQGYASGSALANARLAAVRALLAQGSANTFVASVQGVGSQALALSSSVNPILSAASPAVDPLFTGLTSSIATQLHQVAKMIAARGTTGARRQIFFVQLGSFDTHSDQVNRQQALFADLSPALKAFYDATAALGTAGQVDDVHAIGLRPHVGARIRRRHRPCVGQPPLHHRRRGGRRDDVRTLSAARGRRPRRRRERGALATRRLRGSVRIDARAMVRRARGKPRDGVSQRRGVRDAEPGVHGLRPTRSIRRRYVAHPPGLLRDLSEGLVLWLAFQV